MSFSGGSKMTISFIIPVYNAAPALLRACLDSIIAQDIPDIEILIADDCSTSAETVEFLESCTSLDNNIRVLHNEINGGPSAARNNGLDNASGKYIYFADADDEIAPGACKDLLELLSGGLDTVIFGYETVRDGETLKNSKGDIPDGHHFGTDNKNEIYRLLTGTLTLNNVWRMIFSRDIIENNSLRFPKDIRNGEDFKFITDYLEQSKNGIFIDKPLYRYTLSTGGITGSFDIRKFDYLLFTLQNRLYLLEKYMKDSYDEMFAAICEIYIAALFRYCAAACAHGYKKEVRSILKNSNFRLILESSVSLRKKTAVCRSMLRRGMLSAAVIAYKLKHKI